MPPIEEELGFDISDALSALDRIDDRFQQIVTGLSTGLAEAIGVLDFTDLDAQPITDRIDAAIAGVDAEQLGVAIEEAVPDTLEVPVSADTAEAAADIGAIEGETIEVSVSADTAEAAAEIEDLGASASGASGSVEGLSAGTEALGGIAGLATGDIAGLGSAIGGLNAGAAAAVGGIAAVASGVGVLFDKALQSERVSAAFATTLGTDLAAAVEQVDVAGLNLSLEELAETVGSDDEALRSAATSTAILGLASGATADEVETVTNRLSALAASLAAANPALGDAGTIQDALTRGLQRGGPRLARYGINLDTVTLQTKQLTQAGKDNIAELTPWEKLVGGVDLAMEQLGGTIEDRVVGAADNAALRFASLREQFENTLEAIGAPLLTPLIESFEAFIPIATTVGEVLGEIGETFAPLLASILEGLTPGVEAFGEAFEQALVTLQPAIEEFGIAFGEVLAAAAPAFTALAQSFVGLAPVTAELLTILADILTVFEPLIGLIAGAVGAISGLADGTGRLGTAFEFLRKVTILGLFERLSNLMDDLGPKIAVVVDLLQFVGAAVSGVVLGPLITAFETLGFVIESVGTAIDNAFGPIDEVVGGVAGKVASAASGVAGAIGGLASEVLNFGLDADETADEIEGFATSVFGTIKTVEEVRAALDRGGQAFADYVENTADLGSAGDDVLDNLGRLGIGFDQLGTALQSSEADWEEWLAVQDRALKEQGVGEGARRDFAEELNDERRILQANARAQLDLLVRRGELTQAEVDAAIATRAAAGEGKNYAGVLDDVTKAQIAAVEAAERQTVDTLAQSGAWAELSDAILAGRVGLEDALAIADEFGVGEDKVTSFISAVIGSVDELVGAAESALPTAASAFDEYARRVDEAEQAVAASIQETGSVGAEAQQALVEAMAPTSLIAQFEAQEDATRTFHANLRTLFEQGRLDLVQFLVEQGPLVAGDVAAQLVDDADVAAELDTQIGLHEDANTDLVNWYRDIGAPAIAGASGDATQAGLDAIGATATSEAVRSQIAPAFGDLPAGIRNAVRFDELARIGEEVAEGFSFSVAARESTRAAADEINANADLVSSAATAAGESSTTAFTDAFAPSDDIDTEAETLILQIAALGATVRPTADLVGESIGKALGDGIAAGITAATPAVTGATRGLVDSAEDQAKIRAGISSPSRLFMRVGDEMIAGLIVPFENLDLRPALTRAFAAAAPIVTERTAAPISVSVEGSGESGPRYNVEGPLLSAVIEHPTEPVHIARELGYVLGEP